MRCSNARAPCGCSLRLLWCLQGTPESTSRRAGGVLPFLPGLPGWTCMATGGRSLEPLHSDFRVPSLAASEMGQAWRSAYGAGPRACLPTAHPHVLLLPQFTPCTCTGVLVCFFHFGGLSIGQWVS